LDEARSYAEDSIGPADNVIASANDTSLKDYGRFEPNLRFSKTNEAVGLLARQGVPALGAGFFDDPEILAQFSDQERQRIAEDGNGFLARADLDRNGTAETYRTGYFRAGDSMTGLFLMVFENGKPVDVWTELRPDEDILWISTRLGGITLWHCNCPQDATVTFSDHKLHVEWSPWADTHA